jgi:hypothetical protein
MTQDNGGACVNKESTDSTQNQTLLSDSIHTVTALMLPLLVEFLWMGYLLHYPKLTFSEKKKVMTIRHACNMK